MSGPGGVRSAVRMDEADVASFLGDNVKVQVASLGRDGAPHLATLFYVVEDGRIAFWTYARSQKIRNLERDPRVGCLVEDGLDYFELRGVTVRGRAEILREEEDVRRLGSAVVAAMTGAESFEALGDLGRDEVERQVPKRVAVLVHPEHVASWDHRKLLATGG